MLLKLTLKNWQLELLEFIAVFPLMELFFSFRAMILGVLEP